MWPRFPLPSQWCRAVGRVSPGTCILCCHLEKLLTRSRRCNPGAPLLPAVPSPGPWPCLQVTLRLDTHPAMITVLEMGAARHFVRMQQLAKSQEERAQLLQPTLEINPRWAPGAWAQGSHDSPLPADVVWGRGAAHACHRQKLTGSSETIDASLYM